MNGCSKKVAVERSKALVQKLGDGWEPNVWQNMGWHFSASLGSISVHQGTDGRFTALVGSKEGVASGGMLAWTKHNEDGYEDPCNAVREALGNASRFTRQLMDTLISNYHLCEKSNVGTLLETERIPL